MALPKNFQNAVNLLSRLPGIGPRAAERIGIYLLGRPAPEVTELAKALEELKAGGFCRRCFNLAKGELCEICEDAERDQRVICVVEDPLDLLAIEKQRVFKGVYHILGGALKVGQRDDRKKLRLRELKDRVQREKTKEVIIATNPTTGGDMLAVAVKEELADFSRLKISRIGRGMPTGGDIEYADGESIAGSFRGRVEF